MSEKTESIKKEQNFILQQGDAQHAYRFALTNAAYSIDVDRLSALVGKSRDVATALKFANNIRDADIAALQPAIIQYGNAKDAYAFACIKGADIKALEKKIIKSNGTSAKVVLDFLSLDYDKDVKGLCNKILSCKDTNACYALDFIYNIGYSVDSDIADMDNIVDMVGDYLIKEYNGRSVVMQKHQFSEREYPQHYNNAELLNSFVTYLENPSFNLDKYQDAVITKGTAWDAYHFAKTVNGANIKKLATVAVRDNDNDCALKFAELLGLSVVGLLAEYLEKSEPTSGTVHRFKP